MNDIKNLSRKARRDIWNSLTDEEQIYLLNKLAKEYLYGNN